MCLPQGLQHSEADEARTRGLSVKHSTTEPVRSGEKEIKCKACQAFYRFVATSLTNSIIQEQ